MKKINKFNLLTGSLLAIVSVFIAHQTAMAAETSSFTSLAPAAATGMFTGSVEQVIQTVFNFGTIIAGAVFLILFLIGAVQRLVGSGDEKATQAAQSLMLNAAIGLVIVLSAWGIGRWIGNILKIPGF